MFAVNLYIWAVVATAGTQMSVHETRGWIYMGEYSSHTACQAAISTLNIAQKVARCVAK